jgi:hypothetical protein
MKIRAYPTRDIDPDHWLTMIEPDWQIYTAGRLRGLVIPEINWFNIETRSAYMITGWRVERYVGVTERYDKWLFSSFEFAVGTLVYGWPYVYDALYTQDLGLGGLRDLLDLTYYSKERHAAA